MSSEAPVAASLIDLDTLIQLDLLTFPEEFLDRPTWENAIERGNVLVVGSPVKGFLLFQEDEQKTHFARLGVHPNHRRQGYGTLLLRAGQARTNRAQLLVGTGNRRAITLYERLGFVIVGEFPSQGRSGYFSMHWRAA